MTSLIERVRGLTAPDRELDWSIHRSLFPDELDWLRGEQTPLRDIPETYFNPAVGKSEPMPVLKAGAYTASIDAALALVERVLPGQGWCLYQTGKAVSAAPFWFRINNRQFATKKVKRSPTPALAIILALLTALAAKENHSE